MSFTLDTTKFNRAVAMYQDRLGMAAPDIVRTQGRLLLKMVIRLTPPKSLAQGRNAVARDIRRSMTPLDPDFFRNERLQDLARRNDTEALNEVIKRSGGWKGWVVSRFDKKLHTGQRDRRGRVQRDKRKFVTDIARLQKYTKDVQQRVGQRKAGWGRSYEFLGGTLPKWIARHTHKPGYHIPDLGNKQFPSITIGNFAPGITDDRRVLQDSLRIRAKSMTLDVNRKLREISRQTGFKQ
jgi:hypothetical protein